MPVRNNKVAQSDFEIVYQARKFGPAVFVENDTQPTTVPVSSAIVSMKIAFDASADFSSLRSALDQALEVVYNTLLKNIEQEIKNGS